jgi:hypothetical protein
MATSEMSSGMLRGIIVSFTRLPDDGGSKHL